MLFFVLLFSKMSSLPENVRKIRGTLLRVNAHPHGSKLEKVSTAVNRINTVHWDISVFVYVKLHSYRVSSMKIQRKAFLNEKFI